MKPIDVVRNAYRDKRRSITVPEWQDMELYFGPLTVNDMIEVEDRLSRNGSRKDGDQRFERNIQMLIMKAQTKEGKPIFHFGDASALMREADLIVINRVVSFMWADTPELDTAKEMIEADPT